MHVENVFRALVAIASPMDKYFLCEETDRICNLHSGIICETGSHWPLIRQLSKVPLKDFDVTQVLRRNAAHPLCCILFPPPAHGTTYQRCKKFRVERNARIGQSIVGSGRSVMS